MHLAVDATAVTRNMRGMGRYARCLLAEMPRQRPTLRYTIFAKHAADVAELTRQLSVAPQIAERSTFLPVSAMAGIDCDAAWYPCNFIAHRPKSGAIVATVHDLYPMLQLDGRWWKFFKRARARFRYGRTVAQAHHLLTVSNCSGAELLEHFGVGGDRVSVVPNAADDFQSVDPTIATPLLDRLGVTGAFLLAVGSQEPRKNLEVLFTAMRTLEASGTHIPLVLCGPRGVHGMRPGDAAPAWLRHAGFVSDDELAALYARATALVFPSWYEGFGLPVLEAMTVGGVVICADASTLPEVGGDAALYFPPHDAAALAAQIRRLLTEPDLRDILRAAGRAQAANYSWARTARGTLAGFDRAMAAHHRAG